MTRSDTDLLAALRKEPSVANLRPLIERYEGLVRNLVIHQIPDKATQDEYTAAVFVTLARGARHLRRRTFIPGWLFQAAVAASKRHARNNRKQSQSRTVPQDPASGSSPPLLDSASAPAPLPLWPSRFVKELARLRPKPRNDFIATHMLGLTGEEAARLVRRKPARVAKLSARTLKRLRKRLARGKNPVPESALARALAPEARPDATEISEAVVERVTGALDRTGSQKTENTLAGRIASTLIWMKWRRWFGALARAAIGVVLVVVPVVFTVMYSFQNTGLLPWILQTTAGFSMQNIPGLIAQPKAWPDLTRRPLPSIQADGSPADVFKSTNVWVTRLNFTAEQWEAIQPRRIPPSLNFNQPGGRLMLRNPKAQRSGVAGMLGFDFNWAHAEIEFGGTPISDAAIRFKGNGTFLGSLYTLKRPFKVDLDKSQKDRRFAGLTEFTFNNLIEDSSRVHDALGYELFRDLGVPSPRTAYAWLVLNVPGLHTNRHLGLYALIESVDERFAADRFGDAATPIFKPSTQDLFSDLGTNWSAYEAIYDLKTRATPQQLERIVALSKLVTDGDDATYARRIGEFVDLEEFARFLAGQVLLASYDGFLTTGQNYHMFLHPTTGRFGFIPWDLDHAWGEFPYVGTSVSRERASIWHPWSGPNRFLERTLGVPEFRTLYEKVLRSALQGPFLPERLIARIDALTPAIRECVEAESDFWLARFDKAVSSTWDSGPRDGASDRPDRPVHQLKRFIVNRAASVKDQLDGKSGGVTFPPAFSDQNR